MHEFPSAEVVCKLSISKFNSLPKTGKPIASEWTVLAAIIQHDQISKEAKVVALGTGTKCIGHTSMCPLGQILNDSHAEVLARRAFLRYIYSELSKDSGVFSFDDEEGLWRLRGGVTFHFFSSQTPCGDACIAEETEEAPAAKRLKAENGEVVEKIFTGAKLLESAADQMHQKVGAIRIKPGRGVQTMSLSCSDKISRWNVLGVQGALLDSVLKEPIYLQTFTFSCDIDRQAVERAIFKRYEERTFVHDRFKAQKPEIRKCSKFEFEYSQNEEKQPAPGSLIWCEVPKNKKPLEVSVNGKKQGVTQKTQNRKSSSLKVCKALLKDEYCQTLKANEKLLQKFNISVSQIDEMTYSEVKTKSVPYQNAWKLLREDYFCGWTEKDDRLLDFR